ncbi:hypothetical protein DPMN_011225 [Dreissena polymorpha]|uniref:Uncharacterized protein n=1 Tax=Dreissena polymorpha TaxID=45954 RepID=A0A9D4N4M3_DREPO|nr:hypothetical protein DPMN_011225 [Dreissena polymorpha]
MKSSYIQSVTECRSANQKLRLAVDSNPPLLSRASLIETGVVALVLPDLSAV